jgi:RimJ/RimL family protein N-acetyltransferase
VAKNQEAVTAELEKAKYLTWLNKKQKVTTQELRDKIRNAIVNMVSRYEKQPFQHVPCLVDGFGATRVAELIIPTKQDSLFLSKATLEDRDLYFYWANDRHARKNSFRPDPIGWETHTEWFEKKLNSGKTFMWLLKTPQGLPVGQIRFDIRQNRAYVSYSLDNLVRGRGWGKQLVRLGYMKMRSIGYKDLICGLVKSENQISRKIFLRLGFKEELKNGVSVFKG